jgi:hypothetical protein
MLSIWSEVLSLEVREGLPSPPLSHKASAVAEGYGRRRERVRCSSFRRLLVDWMKP